MRAALLSFVLLSVASHPFLVSGSSDIDPVIAIISSQVKHAIPVGTIPPALASNGTNSESDDDAADDSDSADDLSTPANNVTLPPAASIGDEADTVTDANTLAELQLDDGSSKKKVNKGTATLRARDDHPDILNVDTGVDNPVTNVTVAVDVPDNAAVEVVQADRDELDGGSGEAELGADDESAGYLFKSDVDDEQKPAIEGLQRKARAAPFTPGQRALLASDQAAKRDTPFHNHQHLKAKRSSHGHDDHRKGNATSGTPTSSSSTRSSSKPTKSVTKSPKPKSTGTEHAASKRLLSSSSAPAAPLRANANAVKLAVVPVNQVTAAAVGAVTGVVVTGTSVAGSITSAAVSVASAALPVLSTIAGAIGPNGSPIVITVGATLPVASVPAPTPPTGAGPKVSWLCQSQYNPTLKGCTGTPVYNKRDVAKPNLKNDPFNCGAAGNVCFPEVVASGLGTATCAKGVCKLHCGPHYEHSMDGLTCVIKPRYASILSKASAKAASKASQSSANPATLSIAALAAVVPTAIPALGIDAIISDVNAAVSSATTAPVAVVTGVPVAVAVSAAVSVGTSAAQPALTTISGAVTNGVPVVAPVASVLPAPSISSHSAGTGAGVPWLCQTQYNPTLQGCTGTPVYNRKRSDDDEVSDAVPKMERRVRRA